MPHPARIPQRALRSTAHASSRGVSWVAGVVWLFAALLMLLVIAAGCSDDGTSSTTPVVQSDPDVDEPLGGYDAQDEEPAFGDSELAESVESETEFEDSVRDLPVVADLIADSTVRAFAVTVTWGVLRAPADVPSNDLPDAPVVDWSGRIAITRGALVLNRVLDFEAGDLISLPRENPQTLEWRSETGVDFDGLRMVVYLPGRGPIHDDVMEIETPLFSARFDARQLLDLDVAETFDEVSQQIRVQAFALDRMPSHLGFANGEWTPADADGQGTFSGRWIDSSGAITGFVHGVYGVRDGERLLFGKLIDRGGAFLGFVSGEWQTIGFGGGQIGDESTGIFDAEILRPRGDSLDVLFRVGRFQGRWRLGRLDAGTPESKSTGTFDGRWCLECDRVGSATM